MNKFEYLDDTLALPSFFLFYLVILNGNKLVNK